MNEENISDEFVQKISFHMLQLVNNPHRSIEFTERLMKDHRSDDHIKRVCAQLVERLNKFKPRGCDPDVRNLEFAASWMQKMNFQDHYMRMAGMFLALMIDTFFGVSKTSPECAENSSV